MITQNSINQVIEEADIVKVIEASVELKKRGANYSGCCPFHDEKTPSFSVSPSKGIFKCFGCGASGNVVSFVMEKERLQFPEAIRHLARQFSITLEETVQQEEDKEVKEKRLSMLDINKAALRRWQKAMKDLPADHWASIDSIKESRMLTASSIVEFQLGYAPDNYHFLSKHILANGLYEHAFEIGLVNRSEQSANVYDVFRDRLIFPIHNERGEVIAFSGRKGNDENKDNPKYMNSKDSLLYRKYAVLYGLFQAQKDIRKQGVAILVEGNVDVIMMHQAGIKNTVAACGTSFTESHAKKLAKYCKKVMIMFDGDEAGRKATMNVIDVCLQVGLITQVVPLSESFDPDELIKCDFPECCTEIEEIAD